MAEALTPAAGSATEQPVETQQAAVASSAPTNGQETSTASASADASSGLVTAAGFKFLAGPFGAQKRTGSVSITPAFTQPTAMSPYLKRGYTQCSVHTKVRTIDAMMEDGEGGYRCKPENQCSVGDSTPPPAKKASWSKKKATPCWYWGRGNCMAGTRCPFAHDGPPGQGTEEDSLNFPCWFHMKGYCAQGAACGYSHEAADRILIAKGGPVKEAPRTMIVNTTVTGTVKAWRGLQGWILPHMPIQHPMAFQNRGCLHVNRQDLLAKTFLTPGRSVAFQVFLDNRGLGACDVFEEGEDPVLEAMHAQPMQAQPMQAQPMQAQPQQIPALSQAMPAQPMLGQPMLGQPIPGQPILGQPTPGQPIPGQPITALPASF